MPIFRKGTIEDVKRIAELESMIFPDAWTSKSIGDTLAQKQAFVVVAEVDNMTARQNGAIVGYCIVYHVLDEAEIARIGVDTEFRRRGLGKGLLDFTCECCREMQIEQLLLDVRESNLVARAFYEKYGFETDGIRKNFYEKPREDAILMSIPL